MANPKWFDDNVYMNNKLAQLKAADADTYGSWDMYQLENAFTEAGFGGAEGAYAHFNEYGNSKDENISPNANFIASQYYVFKAADLYHDGDVNAVTSVESAYVASAIKEAGMSAWQHYIDFGTKEGINPSNNFDTAKYLQAKADALNAQAGTTEWTADKVADAFKAANMNALSHAMQYADGSAGEAAAAFDSNGKPTGAYAVDNKISGGDAGQTFTLTQDIDDFTGTDGDDVFIGNLNGNRVTIQSGDKINGGEGEDTFEIYGGFNTMPSNISSIEVFKIDESAADLNLSQYTKAATGLEKVVVNNASALNGTVTTSDGQSLSLSTGATNLKTAGNVTWAAGTTDTSATLTLNGYQGKATLSGAATDATNFTITGAKLETMNIVSSTAANKVAALDLAATTKTLVLTGDQAFTATAVTAGAQANKLGAVDASAFEGDLALTFGAATSNTFTYAGGKGKDTLTLNSLKALKEGSQLDGGDGDADTLIVGDATAAPTAAFYTALNAVKGFETVGFDAVSTIDASKVTNTGFAKHFADYDTAAALTINKIQDGTTVDVMSQGGTLTMSGDTGVKAITMNLGTETSKGVSETATTFTGINNITITSNGDNTVVNDLGAVTANAESSFVVSGANGFKMTSALAQNVNASGLTGNLELGGVTVAGDAATLTNGVVSGNTLISTGSGNDKVVIGFTQGDAMNSVVTLAAGAGEDYIGVNIATAANFVAPTAAGSLLAVKNFELGKDHLYFGVGNAAASTVGGVTITGGTVSAKGIVTGATLTSADAFLAALNTATAGTGAGQGVAYTDGTDTYVAVSESTTASQFTVVKLAGVVATELVDGGDGGFTLN